jgi:hypothetical protein
MPLLTASPEGGSGFGSPPPVYLVPRASVRRKATIDVASNEKRRSLAVYPKADTRRQTSFVRALLWYLFLLCIRGGILPCIPNSLFSLLLLVLSRGCFQLSNLPLARALR